MQKIMESLELPEVRKKLAEEMQQADQEDRALAVKRKRKLELREGIRYAIRNGF